MKHIDDRIFARRAPQMMMLSSPAYTLVMLRPFLSLRYGALARRRQNPNQRVPDHGTRREKMSVARREILGYPRAKHRRVVPAPSLVPSVPGGFSPPWAVVFSVERIFSAPL